MPPKDTGVTIDLTVKQVITGVISIASAIVGMAVFALLTFAWQTSHNDLKERTKVVEDYTVSDTAAGTEASTQRNRIEQTQQRTIDSLRNDLAKYREEQLNLRRDGLTFGLTTPEGLTKREKQELKKLEEYMVKKQYLDPDLLTKF